MELRKLQRTPDGTFLVTIPKAWAKRVGLGAGSVVSYEERQDGRLLLSPKIDEERAPLEVVLDASPFVRREIIERYLLGYDIIRVQSKDSFSPDIREEVRRTTKRLVGLEVLEEDSKRIVLQCLVEPSLLNPERILRRLEMLSMPMQLDSVQAFVASNGALAKGVVERDEEVDRWYFLLVRLVRAAISDTYLLEKIKVSRNNPKGRTSIAGEDWHVGEHYVPRRSRICSLSGPEISIVCWTPVQRYQEAAFRG